MNDSQPFATDLSRFLDRTGYSVSDCSRATGVEQSRLARIVSGNTQDPLASAYLAIVAWAEKVAKAQKLKPAERLAWAPRSPQHSDA